MTNTAEKPYPLGRTYLYSRYKGVPPPQGRDLEGHLTFKSSGRLQASSTSQEFPIVSSRIFKSPLKQTLVNQGLCTYQCQAAGRGGGGRQGIGQGFDWSLWPGVEHLNYLAVSGGRDIWIFVRACDHKSFPGLGNFSYIWPHIFAQGREFYCNFFGKCQIPALCPAFPPPLPPHQLDTDRCINSSTLANSNLKLRSYLSSLRHKIIALSTWLYDSHQWMSVNSWTLACGTYHKILYI